MRIDDARKIARTVSAFANTDGGRLLIGVKDNGMIAGVNAEEEMHMMEAAAQVFCKPPVGLEVQFWKVDFKTIIEVNIAPSQNRPHLAQLDDGTWKAFVRRNDENFLAPAVLLEVWKSDDVDRPNKFFYTEKEKRIFQALKEFQKLSQNQIAKRAGINRMALTKLLSRLVRWGLLEVKFEQNQVLFELSDNVE